MAHPARNACPEKVLSEARVFFVTTKTSMARRVLQSERNAMLLIDLLRSNVAAGKFQLHDFVIMPDHLHLLMTLPGNVTVEKAVQLIKGGFSYRLRRAFGYQGEIWQRGFSDVRIRDARSFLQHRAYIVQIRSKQVSWIVLKISRALRQDMTLPQPVKSCLDSQARQ